jgi:hypothetical protein
MITMPWIVGARWVLACRVTQRHAPVQFGGRMAEVADELARIGAKSTDLTREHW